MKSSEVLKIIKNMAIKYLLKSLKEKGIIYNKGKIEIEERIFWNK